MYKRRVTVSPDEYIKRAKEHFQLARGASDPGHRKIYLQLASGYLDLAQLARKNQRTDIVYEIPPPRGMHR